MSKKIISLGLISVILMPATAIACNNNSSNKNKPSFKSNFKLNNSIVYTPKKIAGVIPIYEKDYLNWHNENYEKIGICTDISNYTV